MKQMILDFCFLVLIIYATYINLNLSARMNREMDLSQVVSHCVWQTLWMDAEHGIHGNKEMKEFFEWMLSEEISSKGDYEVDYIVINQSLQEFTVEVTQHYESIDGKPLEISVKKTASLKGKKIEDEMEEVVEIETPEIETAPSDEDADVIEQDENFEMQTTEEDYSQ